MKRFFRFVMAAAVIFSAVSCAKEDISSSIGGGEVEVTFTANLADLGTRADDKTIGLGKHINVVYLGVYEHNNPTNYLASLTSDEDGKLKAYPVANGQAKISVVLLKNKMYDLVFWAQKDGLETKAGEPVYTMEWNKRQLNVNYGDLANIEERDAFFDVRNGFLAGGNPEEHPTTFYLKRPFAQLNAGLSNTEVTNVTNNGVDVEKIMSNAKVTNVATILKLGQDNAGTVDGLTEVSWAMNAKPVESLSIGTQEYAYVSLNYLLVNVKDLVTVKYEFKEEGVEDTTYEREYYQVPVQRNYRTNIVGNLLSSEYDFTVIIDNKFEEPANHYVTTIADLQAVLDAAKAGQVMNIVLGADLKGDVMAHQKADTDIIIDGNGYKYDGTIKIHNGSNYNNGTITIQNISFVTETPSLNFIMPNEFGIQDGVTRRYSQNVTVKNCSFTATGEAVNTVVGVQAKSCKNLAVIGCLATGVHSLIQAQSCGETVTVKGCTVNGKNGVAFKQVRNAVVEDCTINAEAYGIRFDGNTDNYGIVVKNNKVTALQPLIVRKMTGANNTIALSENELNVVDAIYQIVITNGSDDEAYVYPTGTYTITGHDGCTTYPVADKESLAAAVANPLLPVVEVEGDVENVGLGFDVARDAVLDFNGNKLNASSDANTKWYAIQANGDDNEIIIKNAHFTRAGISAGNGAVVVFENGAIYHNPDRSSRYIFYAYGEGSTITIKDGTFTNDRPNNSFFCATNKATIIVEGGNFGGSASTKKVVLAEEGKVIIKGGTFNFDPTAWLAEGYIATKNGSTWTVYKGGYVNDATAFSAALAEGGIVILNSNITISDTVGIPEGVTATIDLNGKTLTAEDCSAITATEGAKVTVKGNGKVIAHEAVVRAIGGEVIIESGEFTQTGTALDSPATYRYAIDSREGGKITINGGTFKSNNGMINVSSEVIINGGKFENIVEKTMTRHFAYVSAKLTINDGEFYGKANSGAGGCFFCGAASGCDIQLNGGKFTSLWVSGSVNRIFEVYYGGTINVTGGLFNTNGGIATFVTENTDAATKAAYPYVAK